MVSTRRVNLGGFGYLGSTPPSWLCRLYLLFRGMGISPSPSSPLPGKHNGQTLHQSPKPLIPAAGDWFGKRPRIGQDEFKKMLAAVKSVVGERAKPSWGRWLKGLWLSGLYLSTQGNLHYPFSAIVPAVPICFPHPKETLTGSSRPALRILRQENFARRNET